MILMYLLISAIYAGVFVAYIHSKRNNEVLWEHRSEYRYVRVNSNEKEYVKVPTDEWTGFAYFLLIGGIAAWPLMVPSIAVYKLANKFFNK